MSSVSLRTKLLRRFDSVDERIVLAPWFGACRKDRQAGRITRTREKRIVAKDIDDELQQLHQPGDPELTIREN